ncbi:hypothetical protein HYU20_01385 [Candidatus Woesearchaeota archaeon]|nr:hypothetical protein [Candidatus Woesearchaeota archaeon]
MDNRPFGAGKKNTRDAAAPSQLSQSIGEIERRLRSLEEKYSNLERRSQVTEENMLSSNRKMKAEIKLGSEEISELKAQLAEVNEKIKALVREFQGFARAEDVDVIRKYLNLIEPLGFVTQNEVERIVRQKVEEALNEHANVKEEE